MNLEKCIFRHTWIVVLLACAVFPAGCGRRTSSDYIPSEQRCRQALVAALDAWKRGEAPGRIEGTPAVQVGDTLRRPGQILESYEVLGELPSDQGRQFAVRVVLSRPHAEEKINFILIGIDPIWVFRQEEYDMVTHWEHKMPAAGQTNDVSAPKK